MSGFQLTDARSTPSSSVSETRASIHHTTRQSSYTVKRSRQQQIRDLNLDYGCASPVDNHRHHRHLALEKSGRESPCLEVNPSPPPVVPSVASRLTSYSIGLSDQGHVQEARPPATVPSQLGRVDLRPSASASRPKRSHHSIPDAIFDGSSPFETASAGTSLWSHARPQRRETEADTVGRR